MNPEERLSTQARARAVAPVFDNERLRAARELLGFQQKVVAARAGITPAALSQAERGVTTPSPVTLVRLAGALHVEVEAFARRPAPSFALPLQFRHLRRTPQRDRMRARRFIEAAAFVVEILSRYVSMPAPFDFEDPVDPSLPVTEVADRIEALAVSTRVVLGIDVSEPVTGKMVSVLEGAGVAVVRDPDTAGDIDAFSAIVGDCPVVVVDGASGAVWDRDNFNLAHELGHLVMHRNADQRPGTKTAESQAHRFAGAFLAPRGAVLADLPEDVDWPNILELKSKWGLSMAALVYRARDLGHFSELTYARAMRQRSTYGWTKTEPGADLYPLVPPSLIATAAAAADLTVEQLAGLAGIPINVAKRIVGSGPRPAVTPVP